MTDTPLPSNQPPPPPTDGFAITSLVLGILGILTCGVTAIFAIITGFMSRSRIKKSAGTKGGGGMAIAGLILGFIGMILAIPLLASFAVPVYTSVQTRAVEQKLTNHAQEVDAALTVFASENGGRLPQSLNELEVPALATNLKEEHVFKLVAPGVMRQELDPETVIAEAVVETYGPIPERPRVVILASGEIRKVSGG